MTIPVLDQPNQPVDSDDSAVSVWRATVVCPSCSMEASPTDDRQLRPLPGDGDLRRCRNCQAVIDLSNRSPVIAQPLALV